VAVTAVDSIEGERLVNRDSVAGEYRLMRIAVIGSGISGLGAAYLLSRAHEIELFERDDRVGGHAHTVVQDGIALDAGFIVHNEPNYPLLGRLFRELGVLTQESEMSFSVSCACGLEWSGRRPFADPRNALRPRFHSLLWEVGRWLRTARRSLDETNYTHHTLGDYVVERGYSHRFAHHFLVPLTSALWSTEPERALDFPAAYAIHFFDQHGMLGFKRFHWRAVRGGSHTYVRALADRLGSRLHVGLGVRSVRRDDTGVAVRTDDGETRRFDGIVVATHADQALDLLEDPSDDECLVLGAFRYTTNEAALHTDERLLPRYHAARASWNYQSNGATKPTLTYYLNKLQRLESERNYCVTLNRTEEIRPEAIIQRIDYRHPLFTIESMRAQGQLPLLSGQRRTAFAGAHHGYGFHEDGLASGVRAAASFGVEW
jgi:uncharacterized protein